MRLDKFLKVTRIIKRRQIADEVCDNGNVKVNGLVKKSSYVVKPNDVLEISYFNKNIKIKVLGVPQTKQISDTEIEKYIEVE